MYPPGNFVSSSAHYCSSRISSYFCNIASNKFLCVRTICNISCYSVTWISVFSLALYVLLHKMLQPCSHVEKKKMLCAILRAMLHHVFGPLQCFLPNVWQTVSKVLLKYPHLTISLHSMYNKNFLKRSCEFRTELVKFVASEVHTIWCNVNGSNEFKQCEKKFISLVFGDLCNAKMWCIDLFSDPFFPDATRHLPKNRIEVFALLCRFILR